MPKHYCLSNGASTHLELWTTLADEMPTSGQIHLDINKKLLFKIKLRIEIMLVAVRDLESRHPNLAYLYAIGGHSLVSVMQILFKYLTTIISPLQILFMRAFSLCVINVLFFQRSQKTSHIKEGSCTTIAMVVFRVVMLRMLCTSGASAILHYCVKYLPVSTTVALFNTSPIFIYFIEALYYKVTRKQQIE